jgi:rRNA maturation endonuclease Nob1
MSYVWTNCNACGGYFPHKDLDHCPKCGSLDVIIDHDNGGA